MVISSRVLLARTWIAAGRARRKFGHPVPDREELVRQHAHGRSFADIGCMWSVDGAISFLAEESGATAVTGLDLMPASPTFDAEHERRASKVRLIQGDLHDPDVIAQVGLHDVVWCWGVIYHAPNPLLTLERLRSITGRILILGSETIPEVPGVSQACVFLPGLPDSHRRAHASARPGTTALGVTERFDPNQSYGAWWWGISRSALRGMLTAAGFDVIDEHGDPLHATVLARPS